MSELDRNRYTVAWIAPLEIEARAALHMLDERHMGRFSVSRGDDYTFLAGTMCGHDVVIGTFPAGQEYGTGSAAALAGQMKKFFPNLWFGLLVGVAAGLPDLSRDPPRDIRLGDVLVALPEGDVPGIVPYDLGKELGEGGFRPLRSAYAMANTEPIVRSAIGKIKLNAPHDTDLFLPYYDKMKHLQHVSGTFLDPGQDKDCLYEADSQGEEQQVNREPRPSSIRTRVWYGPIGSGEKLMRNRRRRDELRRAYDVIGLEMEAAGIMNRIPVGVVRGVCDYGDEHKNKEWQSFAAAMAAAFAKAILLEISPKLDRTKLSEGSSDGGCRRAEGGFKLEESARGLLKRSPSYSLESENTKRDFAGRRVCNSSQQRMFSPRNAQEYLGPRSTSALSNADYLKGWPEYQTERARLTVRYLRRHDTPLILTKNSEIWEDLERTTPMVHVIYGLSGVGKSQMCLQAISENERRFIGVFYVDAANGPSADRDYLKISLITGAQRHWEGFDLDEQVSMTRAWLAGQRYPWLLMIDNADAEQLDLDRYIPGRGSGTVFVTTTDDRNAMRGHTFSKVGSMTDDDAVHLLQAYKRPDTMLDAEELSTSRNLAVNILGGLPLAIDHAGSYIFYNYCGYADYLRAFQDSPQSALDCHLPLDHRTRNRNTIWTTFTLSTALADSLQWDGQFLRALTLPETLGPNLKLFLGFIAGDSRLEKKSTILTGSSRRTGNIGLHKITTLPRVRSISGNQGQRAQTAVGD
ncbi:hypothetical protein Cob_v005523 [Colletotrichum orbiculare MAFF 240422]|uniref:Uncharacterized protein n=1 Tax=Colletotrichum orbiculare (strain 104-T / ATCC 96160 / CBS 514.97 / LARS 414 / MAFF 240422) TaxID=1213857 RepID=A0A484FTD0_COLOR|nr:hypothetical protein Cob_v005523 [Colletotrichum orbiculare MAFF 240422]